jgi:hypothetical protein
MLGLPEGIGACGTMPVEACVPVAHSRRSVLRKRHHGRMHMTHNPVHAPRCRWRPLALRCARSPAAMHGSNGWTRCAPRHALDPIHACRRELSIACIGSCGSYQASQPGGAVSGQPTLHGAEWDTGIPCSLRHRDTVVEVWPKHRKTPHGLLALFLGACGQSRGNVVLLIHGAHTTPSPVQVCPQGDRRPDRSLLTVTSRPNLSATSLSKMVRYFLH